MTAEGAPITFAQALYLLCQVDHIEVLPRTFP